MGIQNGEYDCDTVTAFDWATVKGEVDARSQSRGSVFQIYDGTGNGNDIVLTLQNNLFQNCWTANHGAAIYPYTDGDTTITDTGSTYKQLAVINHGGAIMCYNCDYNPVDLTFENTLALTGGNLRLHRLSDPVIVLDSYKSNKSYGHSNAGNIFIYHEQALDFTINGATNGPSYMNNCNNEIYGGGCMIFWNPSVGGDIDLHTEDFTVTNAFSDRNTGGFWYMYTL